MADAADSKSAVLTGVRVQVPPLVPLAHGKVQAAANASSRSDDLSAHLQTAPHLSQRPYFDWNAIAIGDHIG